MIQWLKITGIDINQVDREHDTALMKALKKKDFINTEILIKIGIDVLIPDKNGISPLDLILL